MWQQLQQHADFLAADFTASDRRKLLEQI